MKSGVILIDKPYGITSFQAVNRVRKKTGIKKAGHTGTLDPMATGLLTVCLGRATKMARFLTDARKTYTGTITLGVETDTYDAEGDVLRECPVPAALNIMEIQEAAFRLTGPLQQSPPAFSAAKHRGTPLYKLARKGIVVQKEPRQVEVYDFTVASYDAPVLSFTIECSKGTYIRSIAHDLGRLLGTGAHLSSLRRTRNGRLSVEHAVTLDDFLETGDGQEIERWLLPVEFVLSHIPAIIVRPDEAVFIQHGRGMLVDRALEYIHEQIPGWHTVDSSYLCVQTVNKQGTPQLVCMAQWPQCKAEASGGERLQILRVWNSN